MHTPPTLIAHAMPPTGRLAIGRVSITTTIITVTTRPVRPVVFA